MSRAKPYDRNRRDDRNLDAPWKHDLHENKSLSSRLHSSSPGSGSASPSLLNRLSSGRGKELLPEPSRSKLYGFDAPSTNPNAGVELLPSASSSKAARPSRASRNRALGPVDPGQRALVANGLAALRARARDSPASSASERSGSLSIFGAAKGSMWVRVERLARGTTAEDVKSAFAHAPIGDARVTSRPADRTVSVELELPDRDSANALVSEYDGVAADGETLRVTILSGRASERGGRAAEGKSEGGRSELSARMRQGAQQPEQRSGKMYSDLIEDAPREEKRQGSLASRLGRR